MPTTSQDVLVAPPGYHSSAAGLYIAQLEDQSRRLTEDTRGLTPEALAWQPAPGMNTIGMLIAHIAIVEVFWTQVGPLSLSKFESESILGIGMDDDGMPLPAGALPPAGLAGREVAFFDDLLARARDYARRAARALTDADLEREVSRTRKNGVTETYNVRWILYHMLEHFAGHYGQINLLSHQYRLTRGA